jgi:hypothetical protein
MLSDGLHKKLQAQVAALLAPIRSHLLAGVLAFTQAASQVPGVARLAQSERRSSAWAWRAEARAERIVLV